MKDLYCVHANQSNLSDAELKDSEQTELPKYRKWSLVASPYDTLLPPIDIAAFAKDMDNEKFTKNEKLKSRRKQKSARHLVSDWINGTDVEESMWWVAYATQLPTYLGEGAFKQIHSDTNENINKSPESHHKLSHDNVAGYKASETILSATNKNKINNNIKSRIITQRQNEGLLGHSVTAIDLLNQLCRENIHSNYRKQIIKSNLEVYENKIQYLSKHYENEYLMDQLKNKVRICMIV